MSVSPLQFDVVIVGFGPSGATLANLLGTLGINTAVLDRESKAYHLPRAVQFDDEVMRVFQNIGLSEPIEAITRFNPGMRFIDGDDNMLLDWPRPTEVSRQGWHTSYRFHQPDLETLLRAGLQRFPHVTTMTDTEVTGLTVQSKRCLVHYHDHARKCKNVLEAKYVVGCDGANSFTRHVMSSTMSSSADPTGDSSMKNFGFKERWLVVDAILCQEKPELGEYTLQYCVPSRPCTYVRGPGNRRRWEITVLEDEKSSDISQENRVWELLERWIKPSEAHLERTAVYTIESAVAKQWRKGRVMLAGDAAHLTPPFMGQGMCAGIRDASNLGWKLAQCCHELDDDSLLDSYQIEREPHVTEYINTAIRLGRLINTSGDAETLTTALRQPDGTTTLKTIAPKLGTAANMATSKDLSPAGLKRHELWCGTLSSQPLLATHQKLDEIAPYTAILLCKDDLWKKSGLNEKKLRFGATVVQVSPNTALMNYLNELDCGAVFLRADRYILGTASNTQELANFIDPLQT